MVYTQRVSHLFTSVISHHVTVFQISLKDILKQNITYVGNNVTVVTILNVCIVSKPTGNH